ncbi:MAG: class D sortase [Oscillospiraceae bacterium]
MFLPIVFCVLLYALLLVGAKPITQPLANFFAISYGGKANSEANNLYNGLSEKLRNATTVNIDELGIPQVGDKYGKISIDGTLVGCDLYYGVGDVELHNGAGTHTNAKLPGEGGTILIGGHTGTFFNDFKSAEIGKKIKIETYYGSYEYEIVEMKVIQYDDYSAYDLAATTENIMLYTCYPFNSISITPQRYAIYGKFIKGAEIVHS